MRELTFNERITFRGLLAFKGVILPTITMKQVLFYWPMCFGTVITKYAKCRYQIRGKNMIAPLRVTTWDSIWLDSR
jgi:hypothetical protein